MAKLVDLLEDKLIELLQDFRGLENKDSKSIASAAADAIKHYNQIDRSSLTDEEEEELEEELEQYLEDLTVTATSLRNKMFGETENASNLITVIAVAILAIGGLLVFKKKKDNDNSDPSDPNGEPTEGAGDYSSQGDLITGVMGTTNYKITSPFGADRAFNRTTAQRAKGNTKHQGVDLRAAVGTQIFAPFDGTVAKVNPTPQGAGGRSITLVSEGGKYTIYVCHLSAVQVSQGQKVQQGTPIGKTGRSGWGQENKYQPHLHLQAKRGNGAWEDPTRFPIVGKRMETPWSSYAIPQGSYSNAKVFKRQMHDAQGMGARIYNPGNYKGSEFSIGRHDSHGHAVFRDWTHGYAGCAYQLIRYISGRFPGLRKNPTVAEICRKWVGPHITMLGINERAEYAGMTAYTRVPLTRNAILPLLLSICRFDAHYVDVGQAQKGLNMAWELWLSKGGHSDEKTKVIKHPTDEIKIPYRPKEVNPRTLQDVVPSVTEVTPWAKEQQEAASKQITFNKGSSRFNPGFNRKPISIKSNGKF